VVLSGVVSSGVVEVVSTLGEDDWLHADSTQATAKMSTKIHKIFFIVLPSFLCIFETRASGIGVL
jgi:hypothetical protein